MELSDWKVGVYNRTSSETVGLANWFTAFSTTRWRDTIFCPKSAFPIASDRAGSTSFVYCPPPRHGLVPGFLGKGKNHFGLEQSHSVYHPWILIRIRKLQLQTSSWDLYFVFSKRRSRARQRRSGSFWFFQRTSMDGWSLVHRQSGDCKNSGPEDYHGGRRGAVYLCLGIYTNLDEIFNFIHLGWPELTTTVLDHGTSLCYSGPLHKACSSVQRHKVFRGTSSDGSFLSQSALGLSSKFWHRCFTNLEPSNSLRDGEKCGDSVSGSFPSSSSAVSSLKRLHTPWKERKLCRSVVKDFAPSSSSSGVQAANLQTIMDSTALYKVGRRYHILMVTTLVREL